MMSVYIVPVFRLLFAAMLFFFAQIVIVLLFKFRALPALASCRSEAVILFLWGLQLPVIVGHGFSPGIGVFGQRFFSSSTALRKWFT
jgi:hypothetical protein